MRGSSPAAPLSARSKAARTRRRPGGSGGVRTAVRASRCSRGLSRSRARSASSWTARSFRNRMASPRWSFASPTESAVGTCSSAGSAATPSATVTVKRWSGRRVAAAGESFSRRAKRFSTQAFFFPRPRKMAWTERSSRRRRSPRRSSSSRSVVRREGLLRRRRWSLASARVQALWMTHALSSPWAFSAKKRLKPSTRRNRSPSAMTTRGWSASDSDSAAMAWGRRSSVERSARGTSRRVMAGLRPSLPPREGRGPGRSGSGRRSGPSSRVRRWRGPGRPRGS